MARTSDNLNLIIPEQTDYYDVGVHVNNYEVLDATIGQINDEISTFSENVTNLTNYETIFTGDVILTDGDTLTLSGPIRFYRDIAVSTGSGTTSSWRIDISKATNTSGFYVGESFSIMGIVNEQLTYCSLRVDSETQLTVLKGNNVRLRTIKVANGTNGG